MTIKNVDINQSLASNPEFKVDEDCQRAQPESQH